MERMNERITALESVLKKLEPVENILERMDLLEKSIYSTKQVFTFQDACMYIGVSDSMLYKLTANKEEELDEWLLQNHELAADDAMRMATEAAATQPFLKQRRYGKRKKD